MFNILWDIKEIHHFNPLSFVSFSSLNAFVLSAMNFFSSAQSTIWTISKTYAIAHFSFVYKPHTFLFAIMFHYFCWKLDIFGNILWFICLVIWKKKNDSIKCIYPAVCSLLYVAHVVIPPFFFLSLVPSRSA